MNSAIWLSTLCALVFILTGCTNTNSRVANDPLGTGPFDKNGNYREDWVDDPSKWTKPGNRQQAEDLPVVAKNEQPPPSANPLPTAGTSSPKPSSRPSERPKETAATPRETVAKPRETAAKPKPTVVKAKPKPKPKPKTVRYTVKKGDSLSVIASRNGTSVSALRRANGISGSLIRPGQSLVIPKR